jgi:hypothetical protein
MVRSALMVRRIQELASCACVNWHPMDHGQGCQEGQHESILRLLLSLLHLPFSPRRLRQCRSVTWTAYIRANNRPRNRSPGVVAGGTTAIGTAAGCIAATAMGLASTCTSVATGMDGTAVGNTAATGSRCGALIQPPRNGPIAFPFAAAVGVRFPWSFASSCPAACKWSAMLAKAPHPRNTRSDLCRDVSWTRYSGDAVFGRGMPLSAVKAARHLSWLSTAQRHRRLAFPRA